MNTRSERNAGVEILRITAIFFIVLLHVLKQGGVLEAADSNLPMARAAWFLEIAAFCGPNIFALISGYVGYKSPFKPSRFVKLWAQVLFYSVTFSLLFQILSPWVMNRQKWVRALFPVTGGIWWYISCYMILLLLMPVLNVGLQQIPLRELRFLTVGLLIFLTVLPTFLQAYPFNLYYVDTYGSLSGYSVLWLTVMYILGAFTARAEQENGTSKLRKNKSGLFYGLLYLVAVLVTWTALFALTEITLKQFGEVRYTDLLIGYMSPTMVPAAFGLLKLFSKIRVEREGCRKVIYILSRCTLGVYIIHTQPLVWEYWLQGKTAAFVNGSITGMVCKVAVTAVGIMIACTILEYLRQQLFRVSGLDRLIMKTDTLVNNGYKGNKI